MYSAEELKFPWYILAGNHDHYGNAAAQIDFSSKDQRWNFPNLYYAINYELNDATKIRLIMTDSVTLCGNTESGISSFFSSSDQPKGPKNRTLAEAHLVWIENQLKESKDYPYVVLASHFPIYSISSHGPTNCLIEKLQPLIEKYKVSAFLSGHDHNLQHLQVETQTKKNFTMNYVVSGAGAYMDGSTKHLRSVPRNSSKFFYPSRFLEYSAGGVGLGSGGLVVVEAKKDAMTFIFYKGGGDELYRFTVGPR